MARQEQDREDILREAVALVERIELRLPEYPEPIVVGFRREGSISIYFGADPVLQFNARGELRRAFDQGRLLKAIGGKLVSLHRIRDERSVTLRSHELSPEELVSFFDRMQPLLQALEEALRRGTAEMTRQIPAEKNVAGRVRDWLERRHCEIRIASQPHVDPSSSHQW